MPIVNCASCWDNSRQFQDLVLSEVIPACGASSKITSLLQTSLVASLILSFPSFERGRLIYLSSIYIRQNLECWRWPENTMDQKGKGHVQWFSSWKWTQLCGFSLWDHTVVFLKENKDFTKGEVKFRQYSSLQTQPAWTWHHIISPQLSSEILKHTFYCNAVVSAFGKVSSDWTIIHYGALKIDIKCSFHASLSGGEGLAAEQQSWRSQRLA